MVDDRCCGIRRLELLRLLVVEDEDRMRELLGDGLSEAGFEVTCVSDGEAGLKSALENNFDLVVLDGMLPVIDGFEVCRRLRSMGNSSAILLLTARHDVSARIAGLDAGADDYLVKPFSFGELLARIRALGRRMDTPIGNFIEFGDVRCEVIDKRVVLEDIQVSLSDTEFDLLVCLLKRSGNAMSRGRILEEVWEFPYGGSANVVDQYVGYLRRKLTPFGDRIGIETVRGVGYRLTITQSRRSSTTGTKPTQSDSCAPDGQITGRAVER